MGERIAVTAANRRSPLDKVAQKGHDQARHQCDENATDNQGADRNGERSQLVSEQR
jgi:hypothetical protein